MENRKVEKIFESNRIDYSDSKNNQKNIPRTGNLPQDSEERSMPKNKRGTNPRNVTQKGETRVDIYTGQYKRADTGID